MNQLHLLVNYVHDVKDILQLYELSTGGLVRDLPLDVGTVVGLSCKKKHSDFFYKFTSFTTPGTGLSPRGYSTDFVVLDMKRIWEFHWHNLMCLHLLVFSLNYDSLGLIFTLLVWSGLHSTQIKTSFQYYGLGTLPANVLIIYNL